VQGARHEAALAWGQLTRGVNRRSASLSEVMMSRLEHGGDLRTKCPDDGLMAVVSFIGLFAIQAEGVEDGSILHRKQNGVLIGIIRMLMPKPTVE
jgi:hypothetical protein